MRSRIFLGLIIIQVFLIIGLGWYIYHTKNSVLGVVTPTNKETVSSNEASPLEYFYEPIANQQLDNVNEWVPYKGVYSINSDTLNDRFDYKSDTPKDTYRIVALGDSFTFGLYVDTKDNWVELLEDTLNSHPLCSNYSKYEVINLGVYGYDIQYSVERFRLRGLKYNPDLVIWLVKGDDFWQINEVMQEKVQYYEKKLRETGEFEREIAKGNLYLSWGRAMRDVGEELGGAKIIEMQNSYLNDFSNMYKGSLLFVTFENESNAVLNNFANYAKERDHTYLYTGLRDLNRDQSLNFPQDGHPTTLGHAEIAEEIYQSLKESQIICP